MVSFGLEITNFVLNGKIPAEPGICLEKIRLVTPVAMDTVYPNQIILFVFFDNRVADTSGQKAVLYDSDVI